MLQIQFWQILKKKIKYPR